MELEGNHVLAGSLLLASVCVFLLPGRGTRWDPFAPGRLYASLWLFLVGLCQIRLYPEEEAWRTETWVVVLAGTVSFFVGCRFFTRHSRSRLVLRETTLRVEGSFGFAVLEILIFIAGTVLLLEYQVRGSMPLLSDDPAFRGSYGINSYVHRIALTIVPLTSLYCMLSIQVKDKSPIARFRRLFVIGVCTLLLLTMESRYFLALTYLPVIVFAAYRAGLPRRKVFLTTFVPGVLVLLYSRALYRSFSYLDYAEHHATSTWDSVFAPFYLSAVAHFQGLQLIMDLVPRQTDFRYGLGGTLDFITAFVKAPLKLDYFNYASFTRFNFWWNQHTYLGLAYSDFGYVGVILVPFVTGALAGLSYKAMLRRPDFVTIYWYGLIVCGILFSLMTNIVMTFGFVYNMSIVWILDRALGRKLGLRGASRSKGYSTTPRRRVLRRGPSSMAGPTIGSQA